MKPLKSYLAWVAVTLAVAGATTACQDDIDDPIIDAPVAKDQPNTSILELKTKYWNDATNYIDTIGTRDDGSHYVISGRVVSSDEAGNVFKSLVIQDGTAALSLSINSYNLYLKYRRGQEIVLDVTGMYIGKYNGLIQLGQPEWYENGGAWEASFMSPEYFTAHAQLNGFPDTSKLDTLVVNSFSELPTDPAGLIKWQSQLVRFNNVSFANGGKATFSEHKSNVNQSLVDAEGSSINVRTSGYSNFWNKTLPEGHGDVVAILSYYGTSGWQLILNDYEGCMNFGNPTVPEGSQSKPWSVDKAIEIEKAGTEKSGWVSGYIVGAVGPEVTEVKSNDDIEWKADPLLSNTLVIGQTADTKDIAHALVIELPDGSKLQTLGNLVDNPGNYGKQIALRGTLAKAMGTFGITGNNGTTNEFSIEGLNPGGEGIPEGTGVKESPYNCAQVIAGVSGNAWVKGYIVGSSAGKTAAEMTNATGAAAATSNIFIAAKADETDYSKCVPVQLPIGEIRTALNINANPGNLGKVVAVKGSLEKYFGQPGVKTVTEFDLEGGVTPPTPPTTSGDGSENNPYNPAEVIAFNPQSSQEAVKSGVWVTGYIVGWADVSAAPYAINAETAHFDASATMATNILVASSADVKDVSKCIGVQLPTGEIRSALNLQANPGNLGKSLQIKGDIMKYCGVPGIKNATAYKLEGGSTPTPTPTDPVASINENFDASSSIPAGWTQKRVAGDKAWYVPSFNGNNYAAMTGFKGNGPFDQWLISPAIDMSKVSKKVLTFDTKVNGYGSTQSALKVFVLTAADPTTAKTTQLNPTLATAPATGYSDWANSGELDLSAFSGIIYIGFEYTSPVADNYATWCVDNVKLNAEGGSTPDPTPTPTPSGDFKGDFNSFNNGQPLSKPYGTYTNNTGWTATNAIILGGGDNDSNPIFKFIGAAGTLAPTLNGKTSAPGSLVSPALTGSIKTLTFKYGFAFNDSKCQFTVNVKDAAGNVIKSEVVTLDKIEKAKAYDFSLDVNYNGNFTIEIINNCYSQIADKNKDRVSIWNLTWTE